MIEAKYGCESQRRGCVSRTGFKNQILDDRGVHLSDQIRLYVKLVIGVGHDDDIFGTHDVEQSPHRLLQQRSFPFYFQKLLGVVLARKRP